MEIVGGKVSFKRSYQPEQYGSKGAEVEISFSMSEGEELGNKLNEVGAMVKAKALELCGIKTEKVGNALADVAKAETLVATAETLVAGAKPDKAAAAAAMNAKDKPAKKSDAAKVDPEKSAPPAAKSSPAEDFSEFDEDAAESQPEISDSAMSAAMNKKVGELKAVHAGAAPKLVKELINQFVEPPKKSHDIPQNLRAEFLKKLEALK